MKTSRIMIFGLEMGKSEVVGLWKDASLEVGDLSIAGSNVEHFVCVSSSLRNLYLVTALRIFRIATLFLISYNVCNTEVCCECGSREMRGRKGEGPVLANDNSFAAIYSKIPGLRMSSQR